MRFSPIRRLTACVIAFVSLHAAQAASLLLAENGTARQPIVISAGASDATKAVAAELADYLGQITGAKFQVQPGDGARGIVLGTLAEFPNTALAEPLALHGPYDGREAFAIRTEPARLLLIGGAELGASHAAFALLEKLGCRWFFPAREWEVVPHETRLAVDLTLTERPRIPARRIWYGYGPFLDEGHPRGSTALKDYEAWTRHNRMAQSFRVSCGHAWQSIIAANKKAVEEHPEYLALVKGERTGEQLCVSNPEVRKLATAWALAQLEKNPTSEMISMECSDGGGQCECAECAKLGSISNRVFGLGNDVARAVAIKSPGTMIGCLAYNEHSEPPDFKLEPNVYVQLTAGFIRGQYTHEQLLELWPQRCANLGFYEYFSVWLWDFDRLPGGNGGNIARTKTMIDKYLKAGATSFDAESGNNWGVHGRGYYIANKLLWNPDADVPALLADFYEKAFGPGAAAMQRYYERLAPENEPLMSRSLLGEAFRDVEEATRLSASRPDVLARLDQLQHYLRYVQLRWQFDHEKDKAKQKDLAVAAMTAVYRTRYDYMNHWNAMRQTWASQLAKTFNEPGWLLNSKEPKPWIVDQPVSHEETQQWFREGLAYFQPNPVTELKFSSDLVPAHFTSAKPAASLQQYQRPATYAVHSRAGEPIELDFTTGVIAWYRDRAAATYALRDGAGQTVSEGKLPQDGEVHHLSLKVPRAGTYTFEGNDSGAGWKLKAEPGVMITLLNQRGKKFIHLGQMQEMYFYVPKGTKALQYFWNGGPHKLLGTDHKPVAEIAVDDEVVSLPVPAGMDGTLWSLSPRAHSQLWFFDAPNCLAASPEALLLPREVVARDGL